MGCCDSCCVPPKESRDPIRHDPDFSGPVRNRSCTDIIFLIVFILYLGLWGFIGYYGIKNGSVQNLLAPIDSRGRRCGFDSGVQNKPYLVFFDIRKCLVPNTIITGCPTTQVCVESCPSQTIHFPTLTGPFEEWKSDIVCTDDVVVQNRQQFEMYVEAEKCAPFLLKSQPVLYRCVVEPKELCSKLSELPADTCPKGNDAFLNGVGAVTGAWMKYFTKDERSAEKWSTQIVSDLLAAKWYMLRALGAVVIICFIYILLLRWVIAPVVWASIVGLVALLGYALYLCYVNYVYYRDHPYHLHQTNNLKGFAQSIFSKHETWLVLLIALAIIVVILLLILIFLRSRISIAIALIREGSKAITAVKSTVFFPIFPWIVQCAVIGYGVIVLMHLLSIGESSFRVVNLAIDKNCDCKGAYKDADSCVPQDFLEQCHNVTSPSGIPQPCSTALCHFTGIEQPHQIIYMQLGNLLGFFWAMFFVSGVTDMILASTFATWFWTHKRGLPFFTLTTGIYRTVRYHLGTVAFGALIIAIVRVIRVILEYIDHKVKKFDNPLTRCIMCFCKCFFWCLESFLKFINKNAYIMCAIHGKNFCKSASDAFSLLMRNIVRVVVLDKVADFIFFLSKLLISLGVGAAVYYLLEWNFVYEITKGERLNYNYIPAIILSVATYLICTIFFNVYSMAVDTLFLCFLEDCERNDGSIEKPYVMSPELMKLLGKKNKKAKRYED